MAKVRKGSIYCHMRINVHVCVDILYVWIDTSVPCVCMYVQYLFFYVNVSYILTLCVEYTPLFSYVPLCVYDSLHAYAPIPSLRILRDQKSKRMSKLLIMWRKRTVNCWVTTYACDLEKRTWNGLNEHEQLDGWNASTTVCTISEPYKILWACIFGFPTKWNYDSRSPLLKTHSII